MTQHRRIKPVIRMVTESREDGGVSGAMLTLFLLFVLIVVFVMAAVHLGYTWSSIVSGFQKFFGMQIAWIGV